MRKLSIPGVALVFLAACGGGTKSTPPPVQPASSTGPAAPPTEASATPPAASSAAADEADSKAPSAAPAKSDDKHADSDTAPRQKLYRMTPKGLVVDMAGVEFKIKAEAARRGAGWGVKATVKVKSKDGKSHVLLSPEHGPLAFSAKVDRRGKVEEHGDTRKGDKLETVDAGKPLTLSRTWPNKGTKPVTRGQSLVLQVGLWGLGADADTQRPVRQFFEVKMVVGKSGKKPPAVVSPPASVK